MAGPVTAHTILTLDLRRHYDPAAAHVTLQALAATQALRTLILWARGPAGETFTVGDGHRTAPLVLSASWQRYVLPVTGAGRLTLGFGRVGGRVQVRGLQLVAIQAFVWQRDFSAGTVIVNPTDVRQRVTLGQQYRRLAGDQDPGTNTGLTTSELSLGRYSGAILLKP